MHTHPATVERWIREWTARTLETDPAGLDDIGDVALDAVEGRGQAVVLRVGGVAAAVGQAEAGDLRRVAQAVDHAVLVGSVQEQGQALHGAVGAKRRSARPSNQA